MRTLATSVLAFEVVVVLLAIPVAAHADLGAAPAAVAGSAVALVCLLAIGLLRRAPTVGYGLGWAVQLALIVGGLWAWPLLLLGPAFLALWVAALRFGRKADALRAVGEPARSPRYSGDREPPRGDQHSDKEQ